MNIAAYLSGTDLLNFSHASKDIFEMRDTARNLWVKRLSDDKIPLCPEIAAVAKTMVDKQLSKTDNVDKLTYFMHRRTISNWKKGYFRRVAKIPRGRRVKKANDELTYMIANFQESPDRMNTSLSVWDTVQDKLTTYKTVLNLAPPKYCDKVFWSGSTLFAVFEEIGMTTIDIVAIEIDQSEENLAMKWTVSKTPQLPINKVLLGSHFLAMFYSEIFMDPPFIIECLSLSDGLSLFSYTIEKIIWEPMPLTADKWLVFFSAQLHPIEHAGFQMHNIDTEANSIKVLTEPRMKILPNKAFLCDGHLIGSYDGSVCIWDLGSGQVIKEFKLPEHFSVDDLILLSYHPTILDLELLDEFTHNYTVPKLIQVKGDDQVVIEFAKFATQHMGFGMHGAYFSRHFAQVVYQTKTIKSHNWYKYFVRVYDLNKPEEMNIYESKRYHHVAFMTPVLLGMSDGETIFIFDYINTKLYDKN